MDLRISQAGGELIFELGPRPGGFFNLLVSSSRETMWDVSPSTVVPAAPIDSRMVGVERGMLTGDAMRSLQELSTAQKREYPPVQRLVYGIVPAGYHETEEAKPLVRGEKYCVVVFGYGCDITGDYFVA